MSLCVILHLKRWRIKRKSPWVKHALSEICTSSWKRFVAMSNKRRLSMFSRVKINSNQRQQRDNTLIQQTNSNRLVCWCLSAFVCAVWTGLKTFAHLQTENKILILSESFDPSRMFIFGWTIPLRTKINILKLNKLKPDKYIDKNYKTKITKHNKITKIVFTKLKMKVYLFHWNINKNYNSISIRVIHKSLWSVGYLQSRIQKNCNIMKIIKIENICFKI